MCKYKVGLLVNIAINVNTIAKVAIFISFEQRTTSTPSTGLQPITLGLSSLLPVRQDGAIILQGGGVLHKMFGSRVQHADKMDPIGSKVL